VNLIGITWCRNEADLLPFTLPAAIKAVDKLLIIDDDSTDNSYDIIKAHAKDLEYYTTRSDLQMQKPGKDSRQHLLDEVIRRFGQKDTWVQVIESDTIVMETDIKAKIEQYKVDDLSCQWHLLNACRKEWNEDYKVLPFFTADRSPWEQLPYFHWMERMAYSFRALDKLHYTERRTPWPQGFSHYTTSGKIRKTKNHDSPLVMHYGFRNPAFYFKKMEALGRLTGGSKNPTWRFGSVEEVRDTVPFFNGAWNGTPDSFPGTRQGWCDWVDFRTEYLEEEGNG